ncbi:alpha/beta hydrolase [Lactiplantibacillus plantarum]|uniref:serine aminopeptidase domain-containing protein n=1 Tax=Lactiplantibacillus plantarum TaxID=1590 RepID=UPI000D2091E8|nr:alpha/beta hydrolase [Lactiplantibacillus plantarum]AVV98546.1 hydrolase [Lactiplantibacillus plantarum]AVW07097.1 hydrolase [Lactiplantibacillus plantarum]MDF3265691.1 alpha/beta hydrolase [Lactiplantibacillus plantarum]MDO1603730.1 alpha/beta hydrolase [Lactiplantibacillus plantarum]
MKRNSQQSTTVDHYKMFKDGKHWVYAGITIAGLGSTLMLTTNALAATATPVSATTTSAANAPASVASQLNQAAGATATESTTTSSMTTGEDSNTTSNTDSSATTDTNQITTSTNATETSATEQATSAASATDQASEVANSASGTVTSQTTSATNSTAAKAKLTTILDELKELPTDIASTIVGNVLYPIVFTGTGSEALSNLRTEMNQHRYDISNTWTGLDPVAYAADRAAAEEYYPTTVTWWDNVTKETWTLPEYNDPTQSVRAYYIQNGDSTKTVIIGQGWTEHVDWIGYVSKIWYDMGYNVLMPSQRGQFLSDGDNLTFGYQDKYDWLNWVKMVDERNGADSQVVFYGQSLGADTVLEAASVPGLSKSVKAVVSDAGYATLPELGSSLYNKAITAVSNALKSVGLPAITSLPFLSYDKIVAAMNARLIKEQGFSVDDLSATDAASKITIPLLLIHTQDDAFIPYTQSLELAAANHSANQEVWILPGTVGGHAAANNAILQYRQHLLAFLTPLLSVADAEDEAVDVDQVTDNRNQGAADNGTTTDSTAQDNVTDETTADEAISDHQTIVDDTTTDATDITSDTTPDTTNHAKPNDDSTTSYVDLNDTDNAVDSDSDTAVDATRATTTVNQTSTIDQSSVIKGQVSDSIMVGSTATTNTDWLVNHDDSGSAVTASLLQDYSDQEASVTTPATVSATTTNTDSADLVAVSSPASKATTELPQTDETTQSWLATLGTSLLALATGIWAQVRRRFN